MPFEGDAPKAKLVDQVAKLAAKGQKGPRAKLLSELAKQFYANVSPRDLLGETEANLAGAVLALASFLDQRKAGKAKVRAYNPRKADQGWSSSHTVVEVINDDMPFLVDSVTAEINRHNSDVHLIIHPVLSTKRDKQGKLIGLGAPDRNHGDGDGESVMQVHITEQPTSRHKAIVQGLERVLEDVRASVKDWRAMRMRARKIIDELEATPPALSPREVAEGIAFLKWLDDNHFTYLGAREFRFEGSGASARVRILKETGLGILADPTVAVFDGLRTRGEIPKDVRAFIQAPRLLHITKANRRSNVHRPVHMDTVAIKRFDAKGKVIGERLFVGLFTSVAYSRSPRDIPMLRNKIDDTLERANFAPGSHDGKSLMHILETYPRDELFQIDEDRLFETSMGILHLQERQHVSLFVRNDPFERYVSCLVYVPRDRFDTKLRLKLQDILARAYQGRVSSFNTHFTDSVLVRLHLIIGLDGGKLPKVDHDALEAELAIACRAWEDDMEQALVRIYGEHQGIRFFNRFASGFPVSYQDHFSAEHAAGDVVHLDEALNDGLALHLYRPDNGGHDRLHFKVYVKDRPVILADVLPMLENMGLRVIAEVPFEISCDEGSQTVWLHDFEATTGNTQVEPDGVREIFHDAFARIWRGQMENDGFNRLVALAGLTARQVTVLRAYAKYLWQAKIPFSQAYMEETLAAHPGITRDLVGLFEARMDPGIKGREGKQDARRKAILEALDGVSNLDQDRIVRRFLNAIDCTLRTNLYQKAEDGTEKGYLSLKLDSKSIEELPLPRPFREIFVYSPGIEGVHLRFGKVARGGLRWSDRREDFRTEVLGLVKAQQVKNAVIVPVGSKGGFVVKNPPAPEEGRKAFLDSGIACYKTFIRGLLDITDNLKGAKVVPPKDVVRHDEDDPYLVVAADKGTATFSDIANGVSRDYGFWLDDAFASGGSVGYDHKKMGITARGAWEGVKRHFREIGKDIQKEPFTVIGCGDMGGDVFGNGMILSKQIRLLAAFNHLHIFIDPDPDPAATWKERKRLFDQVKGWDDYDVKLISKGGGIFDRKAKAIKITPEMRDAFGLTKDTMTPNELINALLKAPVELLWFGGIGTYVRSSEQSDLEVGDRANDALRVTARQLGAKVIGEGANLGVTQLARIEYGLLGGRCNTDAIDNSAGVDCSDHEVNIKILLGAAERAGRLNRKQRDRLLEKMTDEVAELVLSDNYLQTQAITVTHSLAAHLLDRQARFMRTLEKAGLLNRDVENLPDDETIADRLKAGLGLSRAELAVLLSYGKIVLYDDLLGSNLPDDPYVARELNDYFPTALKRGYAKEIASHQLRREIASTVITNELVNRVGFNFIQEVHEKTGHGAEDVARAFIVARDVFNMDRTWGEVEALDNKVDAAAQSRLLLEAGRVIERITVWLLRERPQPMNLAREVEAFAPGLETLSHCLAQVLSEREAKSWEQAAADFEARGVPGALAHRVAAYAHLVPACDIIERARQEKVDVERVASLYFGLGAHFGFEWLRAMAARLPTDTAWDKLAVTAIVDDLYAHQSILTAQVLKASKGKSTEKAIAEWEKARPAQIERSAQLIAELKSTPVPDLAMLAVANRQLKSLIAG